MSSTSSRSIARCFRASNVTTFVYDPRGLEASRIEALGTPEERTFSTTWHPTFDLPIREVEAAASSGDRLVEYEYDPATAVLRSKRVIADGQTRTWTYDYDSHGLPTRIDGPRSDVADVEAFTYDGQGNLATRTDAVGHVTRYTEYDAHGRPVEQVDPNGRVTRFAYDRRGRMISQSLHSSGSTVREVTGYAYLPSGQLERLTLPDGSFLSYSYDEAGRLVSIEDSVGNRVAYTLNANGDRTKEDTYAADGTHVATLTRNIDTLGRVESETGAEANEATRYTYDANGNEKALTDSLGHTTRSDYDALDRLKSVIDPALGVVGYSYDARDNLRTVTDPRNLVTRYGYSGFDELTRLESPDTGVTQYQYDAAGNLTNLTDARQLSASHQYDALNRVTRIDFPAAAGVPAERLVFGYDEAAGGPGAKGRLTSAGDRSGTTTYRYDTDGRVAQKVQTLGGASASATTVTYGYDEAKGQLTDLTLPSGAQVGYRYGADGRVVTLEVNGQVVVREIEYFAFGEPKSWRYGANGRYERTFDLDSRIRSHTAGRELRTLGYDAASRITSISDAGADRPKWRYEYDALDRLTDARNTTTVGALAGVELGWQYDPTGNRTQQTLVRDGATTTTSYVIEATSNRLESVAGTVRTYDAVGNTIGDGSRTSIYSGRNRLVEVRDGNAVIGRYTHNAFGERVCKAVAGNSCPTRNADGSTNSGSGPHTQFVYDEDGHLIGEYDAAGALIAEHVWLGDTPIATLRPAASAATHAGTLAGNVAVYYVHPDHLDTPRAIVNSNGQLAWRWDSTPFGDTVVQTSPEGLGEFAYALRFPGQLADLETSTHYNYSRDYEPANGRYAQSDTIGLDGGLNTFAYVWADPLRTADVQGTVGRPKGGSLGGRPEMPRGGLLRRSGGRCDNCGVSFGTGDDQLEGHHFKETNAQMRNRLTPLLCSLPKAEVRRMYRDAYQDLDGLKALCRKCHDGVHPWRVTRFRR